MTSRLSSRLLGAWRGIFNRIQPMCDTVTKGERVIVSRLKEKFPLASAVKVSDISGGCGAMYDVSIEAPEFKGMKMIQQHKMVNEALEDEIKDMHGIRITTKVPKEGTPAS